MIIFENIMNKILIVTIISLLAFNACKTKSGDSSCGAATAKCFVDGKSAVFSLIYGKIPGDTAMDVNYTQVTANIYQMKTTFKNIAGTKAIEIPYYFKACGKDIYVGTDAYNFDALIASKNLFVPATRVAGSTWNHVLNNVYYYCGCKEKNIAVNGGALGTITADKLYFRNTPNPAGYADTIYWSDDLGIVAMQKGTFGAVMKSKTY
jgi:hypothetical protein